LQPDARKANDIERRYNFIIKKLEQMHYVAHINETEYGEQLICGRDNTTIVEGIYTLVKRTGYSEASTLQPRSQTSGQ